MPDPDPSLPPRQFAAADPFAALHDESNGVPDLRAAEARLAAGDPAEARESLARARASGIPAEAVPYAAALDALCLIHLG
jgi:hypothetical protein